MTKLIELHWLPITARVQYKLCLLVHSAVVGTAPDYLKNMLYRVSERASQRALRSATNNDMVVPRCRLKFGERAFTIAAPRAWNSIPSDLRATLNTAKVFVESSTRTYSLSEEDFRYSYGWTLKKFNQSRVL